MLYIYIAIVHTPSPSNSHVMDVEHTAIPSSVSKSATRAAITSVSSLTHVVTPTRIAPNVGRRRQGTPILVRAEPSPSHRARMASIFENAAADIESSRKSSSHYCTNSSSISSTQVTRRSSFLYFKGTPLLPQLCESSSEESLSLASTHELSPSLLFDRSHTMLPLPSPRLSTFVAVKREGQEPLSSGFTSPITATNRIHMERAIYPQLIAPDSEDGECHSTHGVPYIIPTPAPIFTEPVAMRDIDAWLDELMDPTPEPVLKSACSPKPIASRLASPVRRRSSQGSSLVQRKLRGAAPSTPSHNSQVESLTFHWQPWNSYAVVEGSGRLIPSEMNCKLDSMARQSSNKENLPPPTISLSWSSITSSSASLSPHCPDQVNTSPKTPLITVTKPAGLYTLQKQLLPSFDAALPYKKFRPSFPWTGPLIRSPVGKPSDIAELNICEDVPAETGYVARDDIQMSPDVQRRWKGKGSKRDRRPSYWDQDIIPEPSSR